MPDPLTKYDADFSLGFQAHVLAVAARNPTFVLRYRNVLAANYFNDPGQSDVMAALLGHVDEYSCLPTRVTLEHAVKGVAGVSNLSRAEKVINAIYKDDISDADAVIARAVEFGKTQAMCLAVLESADLIEKGQPHKVRAMVDAASLVGEDLLDRGINYRETLIARLESDDVEETLDTIPTGLHHLDMLMNGGLGRGELGMFIGSPKRGKTTVLVNIAFGALMSSAGYKVVYYTLEINERKVARRIDTRLAGPYGGLRKTDPDKYTAVLAQRVEKMVKGNLVIKGYPTRAASVSTLRSHMSLLRAGGFHADVVVVDYGDIMKATRRLGESRHEQAGIYEDLRAFAGEFNCAVWTASQANRGSIEKNTPDIDSVAESFEKIAIADAVFGIGQSAKERLDGHLRLMALACRNVEDRTTVMCHLHRPRQTIRTLGLYDSENNRIDGDEEVPVDATALANAADVKNIKAKLTVALAPPKLTSGKGPRKKSGPTKMVPA